MSRIAIVFACAILIAIDYFAYGALALSGESLLERGLIALILGASISLVGDIVVLALMFCEGRVTSDRLPR